MVYSGIFQRKVLTIRLFLHLFAVAALRSKPALVAGHAVVVVFVWDEGLCTDGLLTAVTRETVLVPRGAVVLQHPRSCKREKKKSTPKAKNF